jgi:WhiB family redox-sensing transcriptional regulator
MDFLKLISPDTNSPDTTSPDTTSRGHKKGTGEMFAIELRQELIDSPQLVDPWDDASCRDEGGSLTELFFSDEIPDIVRAKTICAACPLMAPCLQGALERREPWGVWGGQLFLNGKVLAQKRKRGRPPKNPRPEDTIDIQLTA